MQNQRFAALTIILMGMIWLCFPVAPAAAETTQVLQVEATIATVSAEWLPVGDEPGQADQVSFSIGRHR